MKQVDPVVQQDESCPKRVWVMMTLSDDEQVGESGALPQGLQFHLSRCPSCRAVADRLLAMGGRIKGLSELEPGDDLLEKATERVVGAIRAGGALTGRVEIPEIDDWPTARSRRGGWRVYLPYAVAAAVFLAFAAFWATRGRVGDAPPGHGPSDPRAAFLARQRPDHEPAEAQSSTDERGPVTEEPIADERLVQTEADEPAGPPKREVCQYHSHVEAAECEDNQCIHRAVILPDRTERTLRFRPGD